MTKLTARQKFAQKKRVDVDAALDLIDGIRIRGIDRTQLGGVFPATLIESNIDEKYRSEAAVYNNAETRDVIWPLNQSIIVGTPEGGNVVSLKAVDLKQARGKITRPFPRMVEYTHTAWTRGNGKGQGISRIFGWHPEGPISDISNRRETMPLPEATMRINLLAGIQMTIEDYWKVVIRNSESKSGIAIPCDQNVALDFLSLRDVPEGKKRRDALRHWVRTHDRKTTSGETTVREHLRGRQKFSWDGLEGYVEPSAVDLQRNGETS